MRRLHRTHEEKVAEKISQLVNEVDINLDEVGKYIGRMSNLRYNRLMIVLESADQEKERILSRQADTLF